MQSARHLHDAIRMCMVFVFKIVFYLFIIIFFVHRRIGGGRAAGRVGGWRKKNWMSLNGSHYNV